MTWRRIEEYVRGWLPKPPRESDKREGSGIVAATQADPRLKLSGKIASYLGLFLIVLVTFRFVVQIISPTFLNPVSHQFPSFQLVFAAGFVLLVIGMVVRAANSTVKYSNLSMLAVGLTLLTFSTFGIAFNTMLGFSAVNITLPRYGPSLAASVVFSLFGLGGLLLLTKQPTAPSETAGLAKKPYSILLAGVTMNLTASLIQALFVFSSLLPSTTGTVVPLVIALIMSLVVMPLGAVFTIYGWISVFSISAKRHQSLLMTVLAIFALLIAVSLVI